MNIMNIGKPLLTIAFLLLGLHYFNLKAQESIFDESQIKALKEEAKAMIHTETKMAQVMVDKIFSFSELGFQEFESSKYMTNILKENGFDIDY